jgi:segregation and condensation protein A
LIDTAEIAIEDIHIAEITDQYMEVLQQMEEMELSVSVEFLVMAATLLWLKSRKLLPKAPNVEIALAEEEETELVQAELVNRLITYRTFKELAEKLRVQATLRSQYYMKEAEDFTPYMKDLPQNPVEGISPQNLLQTMQKVMLRALEWQRVATVETDEISVQERILEIRQRLVHEQRIRFSHLFREQADKHLIVATFLAVLELMRLSEVRCFQMEQFADILIQWAGKKAGEAQDA